MALRVLLVALVAALGLEWPDSGAFDGWRKAGSDWASARMAEFSRFRSQVELALEESDGRPAVDRVVAVETAPSGRVDLAFEAAVEGMASIFSADLLSTAREARMLTDSAIATRVMPPPSVFVSEPTSDAETLASRLEKISTAVRLTRQAVDAWASLIQESTDNGAEGAQGDSL